MKIQLKNHDWFMTLTILALLCIGLVVIYSSTFTAKTDVEGYGTINRQLIFVFIGFVIYFFVSTVDPSLYRYLPIQIAIFLVIFFLLFYVKVFGDPIRNTNRWIEWGFIRIQPSEYAKVALIILNSAILSNNLAENRDKSSDWTKKKRNVLSLLTDLVFNLKGKFPVLYSYLLAAMISGVCIVLILIEPALGNATITFMLCFSIFFISYPEQRKFIGLLLVALLSMNLAASTINFSAFYERLGFSLIVEGIDVALVFISIISILILTYVLRMKVLVVLLTFLITISGFIGIKGYWENKLPEYQKKRIEVFFDPDADPQGAGWQLRQSKIAIGSGRILGKGFLQGSQSKLRYLPEAYSDFVFAAFCEEFGMAGATVIFALYVFLIIRIISTGQKAENTFESLICYGVSVMIILNVFINIGMNMGIMPVTGIPLPLISYGGSSIMVTMIALGLVQAVNIHRDEVDMQESLVVKSISRIEY
ncbi:MAG: FtsW/RodA/SpoVE family cell cycle protein [Candidatus Dojkabacteria bacterium]|nr:FtsW/RodA/SpoVE family cell cycle protein [Candidatus Dojkabacteria bacterium]